MKKLIIAKIEVKENQINSFLEIARKLAEESNSEVGCLAYRLHQEDLKANQFLMYEEYENLDAITTHQNSKHFLSFKKQADDLLNSLEVNIFDL